MQFPLSFNDISLWLAFTSIVLLATLEILPRQFDQSMILVDRRRLRMTALALGLLSILTIGMVILRILMLS